MLIYKKKHSVTQICFFNNMKELPCIRKINLKYILWNNSYSCNLSEIML